MAHRKIMLEHCTKWVSQKDGALIAVFSLNKDPLAEKHAYGAATHLFNCGVLNSDKRSKVITPYSYVNYNGGDFEIRIQSRADRSALGRLLAANYHAIYERIMEEAGDTLGAFEIYKNHCRFDPDSSFAAKAKRRRDAIKSDGPSQ